MPGLSHTIHQTTQATRLWALVPGFREWVLVALIVVALYGRTDAVRSHRLVAPWARLFRPTGRGRARPAALRWLADRWVLVLALLAGTGVAAWVATSLQIVQPWADR